MDIIRRRRRSIGDDVAGVRDAMSGEEAGVGTEIEAEIMAATATANEHENETEIVGIEDMMNVEQRRMKIAGIIGGIDRDHGRSTYVEGRLKETLISRTPC